MGKYPPCLVGREDVQAWLREDIKRIARGRDARNVVLLHAPRGHGKTAVLCPQGVGRVAAEHGVRYLLVSGGTLRARLVSQLDAALPLREQARAYMIKAWGSLLSSAGSRRMERPPALAQGHRDIDMQTILEGLLRHAGSRKQCRNGMLLVIDEAHKTDPEDLSQLLNAAQNLLDDGLLAVLAGTPDLKPRLDQADATFWDKAERFSPGLLSETEAAQALSEPLEEQGITVEPEVLVRMAQESRGYPYFVQLLGRAAWDALPIESARIDAGILAQALPTYQDRRQTLYEERAGELIRAGLDEAAVVLGSWLQQNPRGEQEPKRKAMLALMRTALVEGLGTDWKAWRKLVTGPALCRAGEAHAEMQETLRLLQVGGGPSLTEADLAATAEEAALDYLAAKGFVWQPEAGGYRLGIPSLHDYLLAEQHAAHV